jgi:RNA recognition motif-containing protein
MSDVFALILRDDNDKDDDDDSLQEETNLSTEQSKNQAKVVTMEPTKEEDPVDTIDAKPSSDETAPNDNDKSKRVYVGNLSWQVDWRDLKDLFKTTDHEVTRADVMQTHDGRSKGCGIVEFATPEGAKQAVLTLNDTELKGRQIFVREDREEHSSNSREAMTTNNSSSASGNFSCDEKAQSRRVYVGNLSWDVQWPDLKDHMGAAGTVVHANVICEHNGRSKGCGIVEYDTVEEAQTAAETLTHTELKGRLIFVREDREEASNPSITGASNDRPIKKDRDTNHSQGGNASVYVWNLSYKTEWKNLKDHMRKTGNVDQATILTNAEGTSIGCGIVVYQRPQEAARAIRELQDSELDGRDIRVREDRVQGGGGRGGGMGRGRGGPLGGRGRGGGRGGGRGNGLDKGKQLYVSNVSMDTDWRKLKDHFKQIGEVDRANAKPGKFGTVRFFNKDDATMAIEKLNGVDLDGSTLEVRLDHKA